MMGFGGNAMESSRNWWLFIACLVLTAMPCVPNAEAQTKDIVNDNTLNHGSTIRVLLQTLDKGATEHVGVADELKRLRGSIGVVFVPGILGSTLQSASRGKLWGSGFPKADNLRLEPELIDETVMTSDVSAELALDLGPVGLYREAFRLLAESAAKLGIPRERVIACGYDWRRDLRWGA